MNLKTLPLLVSVAACIGAGWAQPPEERHRNGNRSRSERPRGPEASPAPVERYLNHLREKNPEEYQHLSTLREQDPSAFRRELRMKAAERRGADSPGRQRTHPLRKEISVLQNAETEAEREAALENIRAIIIERVDRNLEEREKAIRNIREQLQRLEEQNEQERARRGEIIDHHIQRVLSRARKQSDQGDDTP